MINSSKKTSRELQVERLSEGGGDFLFLNEEETRKLELFLSEWNEQKEVAGE